MERYLVLRLAFLIWAGILWLTSPLALAADPLAPAEAQPGNAQALASPSVLGGWGSKRQTLEETGLRFEFLVTTELVANASGGVRQGSTVLGRADLTMALDTEKAGWWSGGTFFVHLLGAAGGNPVSFVGATQVTSNIEAPDTFTVFAAWYEHRFFAQKLSLLFGLHPYDSEFYVLDYAANFLNSSFGTGPEVAQTVPSIFPTTALALRVKYQFLPSVYVLAAVYDGVPGNPKNPRGTHILLRRSDGLFYSMEVGLTPPAAQDTARHYKLAAGAWYHTTDFDDFRDRRHSHNSGVYALGEVALLPEADPTQGLGVFAQVGYASSDRNQIALYLGGGFTYTGLFPRRESDVLGLAVASARNSDAFLRAQPGMKRAETVVELTYRLQVLPWLHLQPNLQYVINPGTSPTLDNALVFALRVEITL